MLTKRARSARQRGGTLRFPKAAASERPGSSLTTHRAALGAEEVSDAQGCTCEADAEIESCG